MSNPPVSVAVSVNSTVSFNKKLLASVFAAVIFILISLPAAYGQTNELVTTYNDGCPTPEGKFIHAALFFAISYFVMKISSKQHYIDMGTKTDAQIAKYAFYGTLLFFLFASTDTYRLTGKFVTGLTNPAGCPEVKGVLVHGLVFLVVLLLIMYFPKDN
jgi:hypothetical protein